MDVTASSCAVSVHAQRPLFTSQYFTTLSSCAEKMSDLLSECETTFMRESKSVNWAYRHGGESRISIIPHSLAVQVRVWLARCLRFE